MFFPKQIRELWLCIAFIRYPKSIPFKNMSKNIDVIINVIINIYFIVHNWGPENGT